MINSDIYLYIIIALFALPLLALIIKAFFSYLRKRKEESVIEEDPAGYLFFEEGELLSALSDAQKDSEGYVDVSSVVEGIIESKSGASLKAESKGTSDTSPYTQKQDNPPDFRPASENGDSWKEDTIFKNDSQDIFPETNVTPPESPPMQTLYDMVEEIKKTDSEVRVNKDALNKQIYRDNSPAPGEKEDSTRTEQYSTVKDKQEEQPVKKRISTIKDVLNEFISIKGVNAVCLIQRNGALIESVSTTYTDFDFLSDNASFLINTADLLGKERRKGPLSMIIAEFKKGFIIGSPISEERVLIIDADEDATLGMIRHLIMKHKKALAIAAAS